MRLASAFGSDKRAIAKTTALEVLSEPLVLLTNLCALTLAVLSPAFHYHQFGEPTRMARDAGISAAIVCGTVIAVYGAIKTFRRDIESGTAAVCLSHGVSRGGYFRAKLAGLLLACAFCWLTVAATSVVMVNGAAIGGRVAAGTGDIAKIWGPSLAVALCPIVLPFVLGAVLNRFFAFRFVLSANVLALILSILGLFYRPDFALAADHLWSLVGAVLPVPVWLFASAAFASRFKANAAFTFAALVVVLQLPFLKGWAILPAAAFFVYLGEVLFDECDIA